MATKIQPITKIETVSYGDCEVNNFWMPRSDSSYSEHKERIMQLLQNVRSGFVCVYSEKLEDNDIIKLLFDLSEKVRIYVLVNEYSSAMDNLKGKALIRYSGVNNVGSFVLVNPNSNAAKGMFFGGQLTEGNLLSEHTSFAITPSETKELFRHFCFNFWERAKKEIIEKEELDVKVKPIDVYYETDKFCGKDYVYGTLFKPVESDCRKNLAGKIIVYCGNEKRLPIPIHAETNKDLGDNKMKELLSKEEFKTQKPTFKDDGVSIQIEYTWQNVPFYLPDNAKEHNLYSQWETEKGKIKQKVDSLTIALSELEKRENTVSKNIARFFLGKKQKFAELKEQIFQIQSVDFSTVTKEKQDKYIRQINKISDEITMHGIEIDEENRKAIFRDEIEGLQKQISDKQQELSNKKEELESKSQELENKETESKENIKISVSKLEDDIKKIENSIQNLNNQVKKKQKEIEKVGSSNKASGSPLSAFEGSNNKKQKNGSSAKPFETQNLPQLPQVGKLFSVDRNHYLAIEYWEDYELGRKECERLNAKLCATK